MAKQKAKKQAEHLTIEYVPIGSVKLDKTNPRIHDLDDVVKSMQSFGIRWPIIVQRSNKTIVAGHGRYKAMKKQGKKKIPVIWWDVSTIEAKAFAIRDNKSTERADWNFAALNTRFESLEKLGVDLSLTGFELPEISQISDSLIVDDDSDDEIPEVAESITKTGDLWQLGEHRLLCGDSTKAEDVRRLMGRKKADMVFTDPPYGVGFNYNKYDDNVTKEEHKCFSKKWFDIATQYSNFIVVTPGFDNEYIFFELNNSFSMLVWYKKFSTSASRIAFARTCELIFVLGKPPIRRYDTDYFEYGTDREKGLSDKHPCPKPISLLEALIKPQTKTKQIVLDLFLGSGSTLIACEKLSRKCFGMEIDPHYCDVIVKRWENYTGKKAKLLKTK